MSGFAPLELQILFINVIGLASSTLNWNWNFKWDRQLERISNFSISQSDELEIKDVDWLKTILSWVVVARFVIDRVSLVAYVANIYTIVTRSWQNLLVLWMVLSFLKDIILEIVVIIVASLLWYNGSVPTSLLIEFIAEKTIWLFVSTCKWCTTLKWYTKLRRVAKIRKFAAIARRSIASIVNIPGRVGHSLDDECLSVAIIRRGKYASLLNFDKLSAESCNRVNFVSLKNLIADDGPDSNDTNDYDSNGNDLSVAEKSMRMLRITAEDVMDAHARIQERSYWSEQKVNATTPEATKGVDETFPLGKDGEDIDALKIEQKDDIEKTVDHSLEEENVVQYPLAKEKEDRDDDAIVSVDVEVQILIWERIKNEFNKIDDDVRSAKSCNFGVERMEEEGGVGRFVQCPLQKGNEDARDMAVKPCASPAGELKAKFCPTFVNEQREQTEQVDRRTYPCRIKTQLMTADSDANKWEKWEHYKYPKASSSACHRALNTKVTRNGRDLRSVDVNDKNIKRDVDGKEFKRHTPVVNIDKRDKINEYSSAFTYAETYRLKKQIQKCQRSKGKQPVTWGSMSLAQTAHPSGYAKTVVAADKSSVFRKNVRNEIRDDQTDSWRYKLKYVEHARSGAYDLRSIHNVAPFSEKNYGRSEETMTDARALKARNDRLTSLDNKGETKARKRHDLSANRKLTAEEREAAEMRALRACNELTSLENKKGLETRRRSVSSLNYERPTVGPEAPGMKALNAYNDFALLEDKKRTEVTSGRDLSQSRGQSHDEPNIFKISHELTSLEKLRAGKEHDSSRDEEFSGGREEDIKNPSCSNHLSEVDSEKSTILSSETRRSLRSDVDPDERCARSERPSLNLREITRNIELTAHPRGIVLANKSLYTQFAENRAFRESQQRDIVDDNVASALHSAFFFKPEMVTRVFQRAHTGLGESLASFPIFRREDTETEFVCRLNNEMIVERDRDSSFDFNLERIMGDSDNLRNSLLSDVNDSRGEEHGRDLCIIFIDREQVPAESETAIIEDSPVVGSQVDSRPSFESVQTADILVLDGNHDRTDNATNDNLPVQFLMNILRDFGVEVSEGNAHAVTSSVERTGEYGNASNVTARDNFQRRKISVNGTNADGRNNNGSDKISLCESADVDETIHEIAQTLNSNGNCSDNVDVTSVKSLERNDPCNSQDERKLSASDIYFENKKRKNNLSLRIDNNAKSQLSNCNSDDNNRQFDTLINRMEKDFKSNFEKFSSKLCLPGPSSFIESDSCRASILKSSIGEELQRSTQLSDNEVLLVNKKMSVLNLETTVQESAKSAEIDKDTYERENEFSTYQFSEISSNERLRQYDSFYSTYERLDGNSEMSISLESSLMEEFSNDALSPLSGVSARKSALSCNFH